MNQISGKYTTKRDGGIEYSYEASWTVTGNSAIWNAKVRRGHDFSGTPGGTVLNVKGIDMASNVRSLVEASIESRLQIQ